MWQGVGLMTAVVFAYGLDYLFNLVSGRLLDPAQFGILVALAGVGQVLVVASRVIQTVVTRYIARFQAQDDGESRIASFFRSMFRSAWRWGTAATVVMLLLSFPLAAFLQIDDIKVVLALSVTTLLMVVRPVVGGTLQGRQQFMALGLVQVVQAATRLFLGAVLILLGLGAFGAMASLPLASLAALIFGLWALDKVVWQPGQTHHGVTIPDMFRYSSYTAVGLIGFALLINMDAILAKRFFAPIDAGNYGAAVTLGKIIQFFPVAVIMLLFPKAAQRQAAHRDPTGVLIPAMLVVAALCGGLALLYALFADVIVRLTVGAAYQVDGRLLGLVGLAMLLLSLVNVWLNYFLSTERTGYVYLIGLGIVIQAVLMVFFHDQLWHLPAIMSANGLWLTLAGVIIFYRSHRVGG
jgi:O-antigen/teichoic acid export membrane protein